jgi:hypothetical protein
MNKFPILQSGFIAVSDKGLISDTIEKNSFVDFVLLKGYLKSRNTYFYSPEVLGLYTEFCADNKVINSIDFKERILLQAFKCFKQADFYDWIKLQYEYGEISELHSVFLLETYLFALYGDKRKINIAQWSGLLEKKMSTYSVHFDPAKYFRTKEDHFLRRVAQSKESIAGFLTRPQDENIGRMESAIRTWTTNEAGFIDLLFTLNVIFGPRHLISDVANNKQGY